MVGSALGDAIGELAFHQRSRQRLEAAVQAAHLLRYTDDTAMAIALAESLTATGDVDPQHLGDTFRRQFRREPWRGYGPGPPHIFAMVEQGECGYQEAARRLYGGEGSQGNGAAMRVAPLGLFFCDSTALAQKARLSASITHAHRVGMDGAALQALAVARAAHLQPSQDFSPRGFVEALVRQTETQVMREKLDQVAGLVAGQAPPSQAAALLGLSVRADESIPFALFCFLSYPKSYPDCVMCACLNGGDRDTMAAMAGAVSGAYLGMEAIPRLWGDKLENRPLIEGLAESLLRASLERDRPPAGGPL